VGRKAPRRRAPRVRLFSLDRAGIDGRVEQLETAGYRVEHGSFERTTVRDLATHPPAAIVLDLSAQPSYGRDIGVALRIARGTRRIPLVFAGGTTEKVERVKQVPYSANTLIMWINVPHSLHGVTPRSVTDIPRRYVNFVSESYTLQGNG